MMGKLDTVSLKRYGGIIAAFIVVFAVTGSIELGMGRSLLGPDGRFGWWEGNIWNSENSQRFADPYSFSHMVHGIVLYALLRLALPRVPVRLRLLMALVVEASWEMFENSPIIIDRYRAVTISLGYVGDSVLNSMSDILMMTIGFLFAFHVKPWIAVATVIMLEVGCALWVRDNLTLNIIMLIHPVDAIRHWQMAAAPAMH